MSKRNRDDCPMAETLAEIVFMICDNTGVKTSLVVDELAKLPSYTGDHRHKSPKAKLLAKDVAGFLSKMQTHFGIADDTLASALACDSTSPSPSQDSTATPLDLTGSQYPLQAEDCEEDEGDDLSVAGSPPTPPPPKQ